MPSREYNKPCETCKGGDCADCGNSPENIRLKLYTAKGAVRAMLTGKILKNKNGLNIFWDKNCNSFLASNENGKLQFTVGSFTGLYEELE